ncbi:flagellar protein FliT [Pseudomonas asiatica]|uniref:flagellar protein FliT n=1 Tax=Pseudomonas asiatica TaxID=2219225 RepID=UPI0025AA5E82|nr:flagellar protein FliT [Pseudomonas asiatica]MDM9590067.1 flagellar protein FliT [Pseudomonas asiatica]
MTQVLQQLDDTRDALITALAARDWEAITKLDVHCRACIDRMLGEGSVSGEIVREKLEGMLQLYRELIVVSTNERQAIAEEMMQINQAKNASKVYHLFS